MVEGAAAVLLFLKILVHYHYSPGQAAARSVVHAISAFNTAGFELYTRNVMVSMRVR